MPSRWPAVEAGTDLRARARQIERSWERVLVGGAIDPELPPRATAGMRPMIVESWRRVLAAGLDPIDLLPSIEADASESRERWLEHPLGLLRHVLVEPLQMLAEESNSIVQVTDSSGLTLFLGGPERLKELAAEMNLVEGARCSETANGTNGVGTALAENRPVQVFAFEHFSHHHREWVCSGAPIHDPVTGRLLGVIDLTSPWKIAHPRGLELVTTAARTTERCLLEQRRDQDARLRRRYCDLATRSTGLLVNRDGYALIRNDAAHPYRLEVPEGGGEIAMDDGSIALAEPLGQGEAYLVRRRAPRRAGAARGPALGRAVERDVSAAKRAKNHLRELAGEQAALRRVATLVAREASPVELLAAVAEEVARVVNVEAVGMLRFEPDGTATLVAQSDTPWDPPPLGTRLELEGENVVTTVFRTRAAARLDDWANATGPVAAMARVLGIRSSVATPIVVEGRLWGTVIAVTSQSEPLPRETDSRIGAFTELVATAIANAEARDELARLGEEQAALRRVATLVAEGAAPAEVFDAVIGEVGRLLGAAQIGLSRYENEDEISVLAIRGQSPEILRTEVRLPLDGDSVNARILRTGRSARLNFAEAGSGSIAEVLRRDNVNATVGAPIVVDGALWGMIGASWRGDDQPPANAEQRVEKFTELVATAIANADSRAELAASEARVRALAAEQAGLRRVATLVAGGASSEELFATVAREAAGVLGVPVVALQRYEADRMFTMVAIAGETTFTVGSRWPVEDEGLAGMILATGRPARRQEYTTMPGPLGAALRAGGMVSAVGVPIVVEGSIWGFMTAGARPGKPIPDGTEERLARFTELVASAIADSQSRKQLARLAAEQAALRRVATMVVRAPASEQLFSTVAREVASVLDVPGVIVTRYEPDGTAVTVGEAFGSDLAGAERFLGIGTPMPPDPGTLTALILDTQAPARVDDLSTSPGAVGEVSRAAELGSGCAGPIIVNGAVWGKMCVFSRVGTVLPAGTENRLRDFIDLIATAIANHEARAELAASEARAGELADEQAALRRVATLVARGVSPDEIFSAVTNEMAQLFGSPQACVGRFEPDGSAMVVVGVSDGTQGISIGSRWELQDYMASAGVYRTGRPVRVERSDLEHVTGPMADVLRGIGAVSNVGAPIVVDGKHWGFVTVTDVHRRLPADAEQRLEKFAELLGTAIANADGRAELAASRARIVAAGDDARRRIERDLHDGAQQRLVTLAVALRRAEAKVPAGSEELRADIANVAEGLKTAVEGLRELSQGIHPAELTAGGLSPALKALGRRSAVRVELDVPFEDRLPDHVEVAAYYTVSEALTNASKHADATRVRVSLAIEGDALALSIRDDGVGGADPRRGSGLTGLRDRIEALGGRLQIESQIGSGTVIEAEIPIPGAG